MNYEEGAVIPKEVSDKWMTMKLRPNKTLRNVSSPVDALCAEYLSKCHIKKLDPEILALAMKVLQNGLKYHFFYCSKDLETG